jgi:C-terminal processing protease CtpA/Prc
VATLLVRPLQGAEREVVLTRGYLTASRAPARREDGEVEDGIVYVAIDGFGSEDDVVHFDALLPRIRQARGLIIDVRRNGGGSTSIAAKVIASLTDRKLPGSRWKTRMHRPAFKAWGQPEEWHAGKHADVAPARDPFLGPVVVLIGPETFSAAEDFLVVLKASERATLVGSRTAGSTGQPLRIELPGGGGARVCSKRDTFPDGTEFVGIGVLPDVEVTVTRQDFVAGRDVVLERGLEELRRRIAR